MNVKVETYNLQGKFEIWSEDLKNIIGITKNSLNWNKFERLFREKYVLDNYYDKKVKEFYELKMRKMKLMMCMSPSL